MPSTWSVCGKARAEAFTPQALRKDRKEEVSQLGYIIGTKSTSTMQEAYGPLGIIIPFSREQKKNHMSKSFRKGKMDGMEADNTEEQ